MENLSISRSSERGAAAVKFLFVIIAIVLVGNAGLNYLPVAYNGASFKQEMDTAVVKALGSSGRMNPLHIVEASIDKAATDYGIPEDMYVDIKPVDGVIEAHVAYNQQVNILPFGLYKYNYKFDYVARPVGYLLKD